MKSKLVDIAVKGSRQVKKNSPLILTISGVVGIGATAVLAYRASKKVDEIVTMYEQDIEEIEKDIERAGEETEDHAKLISMSKVGMVKDISWAMLPTATVGLLSIGAFIGSWYIQNNRIHLLGTALSTAVTEHMLYRTTVRNEAGEEKYEEYEKAYQKANEERIANTPVKKARRSPLTLGGLAYEGSSEYVADDFDYKIAYIRNAENKVENILFRRGHTLLNEVYDIYGFERTALGGLVGWSYSTGSVGLSFNVTNITTTEGEFEPRIWITWNTPTYIWDSIELEGSNSIFGV